MNKTIDAVQVGERPRVNGTVRILILAAVLAALGLSVYRDVLWELLSRVVNREDASHGVCVPFIAAYLFWYRYDRAKAATPTFSPLPGVLLVGAGLGLFYIGSAGTALFLSALLLCCCSSKMRQLALASLTQIAHSSSWLSTSSSPDRSIVLIVATGKTSAGFETVEITPESYPLKGRHLYRITIRLENLSGVSTHRFPYRLDILPLS